METKKLCFHHSFRFLFIEVFVLHLKKWIVSFIIFPSLSCYALNLLPKESLEPGGLAILKIPNPKENHLKGYFNHHRIMILRLHHQWFAIVGIPLSEKSKQNFVTIISGQKKIKLSFTVSHIDFPQEHIQLKHKKNVIPSKEFLSKLARQQKIINQCFAHWRDNPSINMHFSWPVKGEISGSFGLKRYFNGEKRGQHNGIDIAAKTGTYIRAPEQGIILQTGNFYLTGKTIFIDHGQNLITVYGHLNQISVHLGQTVKRGQIIGTVGDTGRATGPHLHWGINLNNTRVNPMLFL